MIPVREMIPAKGGAGCWKHLPPAGRLHGGAEAGPELAEVERVHGAAGVVIERRVGGAEGGAEGAEVDGIDTTIAVGVAEEAENPAGPHGRRREVVAAGAVAV